MADTHCDSIEQTILQHSPDVNRVVARQLAELWGEELAKIIDRMFKLSIEAGGVVLPFEARSDAIFELAKLTLWLSNQIVKVKAVGGRFDKERVENERAAATSESAKNRVEETARLLANHVWAKRVIEWRLRHPFIESIQGTTTRRKTASIADTAGSRRHYVRRQHYVPTFSNLAWSSPPENQVAIYHYAVNGRIVHRLKSVRSWGWSDGIYSQELDSFFERLESKAAISYRKLLDMIPLSITEKYFWTTFLNAQILRSPSTALTMIGGARKWVSRANSLSQKDLVIPRRAYEEVFYNEQIRRKFNERGVRHRWRMLEAPESTSFLKADNPAIVEGSLGAGTWRILYPMTPEKCFVIGPDKEDDPLCVYAEPKKITENETRAINLLSAQNARRTVIGQANGNHEELRIWLEGHLGHQEIQDRLVGDALPPYWEHGLK